MTTPQPPETVSVFGVARWRKSSFSGYEGNCVEVAPLNADAIAVRNSNHPDAGTVVFTRAEMGAWIKGVKADEFDHLT